MQDEAARLHEQITEEEFQNFMKYPVLSVTRSAEGAVITREFIDCKISTITNPNGSFHMLMWKE